MRVVAGLRAQGLFRAWVCLELNLLSFVGALSLSTQLSTRAGLKYFLVQRLGSSGFLVAIFLSQALIQEVGYVLTSLSLILKLAAAPFYGWLLLLAQEVEWLFLFLLRSAQKVLPLFLILQLRLSGVFWASLVRALIATLGAFKETNLKKLMVYSSLFGLAWFFASQRLTLSFGYLGVYSFRFWAISKIWESRSLSRFNACQTMALSLRGVRLIVIRLLNFAGLPPFSLFYFKVRILSSLVGKGRAHLIGLLISAAGFVYIYFRLRANHLRLATLAPVGATQALQFSRVLLLVLRASLVFFCLLYRILSFDLRLNKEIYSI